MKVIVHRNELLAALLFASTDETRYQLCSVLIEVRAARQPTVVATDGRRLVCIESEAEQLKDELTDDHQILLRSDFVKPICALSKALGGKLYPWLQIENKPGSRRVFVSSVGGDFYLESEETALVEGEYPNWRQCLPSKKAQKVGITAIALNSEQIADFARAAKVLEAKTPIIQMHLVGKEQQVEVRILGEDNFYGLVMQCKLDEEMEYQPEFVSIVEELEAASDEKEKAKPGDSTVTITAGGQSVELTDKQFARACRKLSRANRTLAQEP
jgi:hypothetical protein